MVDKKTFLIATYDQKEFEYIVKVLEPKIGAFYTFISFNDIKTKRKFSIDENHDFIWNTYQGSWKLGNYVIFGCLGIRHRYSIEVLMNEAYKVRDVFGYNDIGDREFDLVANEARFYYTKEMTACDSRKYRFDRLLNLLKDKENRSCEYEILVQARFFRFGVGDGWRKQKGFVAKNYEPKYNKTEVLENGAKGFDLLFIDEETNKPLTDMTREELAKYKSYEQPLKDAAEWMEEELNKRYQKKVLKKAIKESEKKKSKND